MQCEGVLELSIIPIAFVGGIGADGFTTSRPSRAIQFFSDGRRAAYMTLYGSFNVRSTLQLTICPGSLFYYA
ncbi:MAG: hypothetical protein KJP23_30920 [Deltaproteobacteria bacterium]|nr:hypothetical protein [Deltaproteobacteria bacterium]